ncbi:uncharacterized protein LOC143252186 isoform X2 [Tachypleus tridentatus]|uniref:uncharacterized protein LOC143252186 isoform X2 n=1 Tax=Tachypleus tridentatus TaxID=6853 RepID=UPI003FD3DCC6
MAHVIIKRQTNQLTRWLVPKGYSEHSNATDPRGENTSLSPYAKMYLREKDEGIDKLREQIHQLREEFAEMKPKVVQSANMIKELQGTLEDKQSYLLKKDRVMAKKEVELKDHQKSYESYQHKIFQLSAQIIQKDGDLAEMRKENGQLQIQINTLLEEVECMRKSQESISSFKKYVEESRAVTPDLINTVLVKQIAENEIICQQQLKNTENIWKNKMDEECQNISKEFMQKMKELEFDLKQKFEKEKSDIEQRYKTKMCEMEKDLKHQFKTEKGEDRKKIENSYKQKIGILQQLHADEKQTLQKLHYDELQASERQQTKNLESFRKQLNDCHQEHILSLKNDFLRAREIVQKDNKESIKLLQEDFEKKLKFECHSLNISHQNEVNELNIKFQNDISAVQMAHHEQFQRLAEDLRRHWEVEKSELQKLHAEEIEAIKENLNRQFEREKQIMKKAHIEETNELKKVSEKSLENIINNLKFFCEEKSGHAVSLEYEKHSLNDTNSFELLKFQEECKSIISGEKQKLKQKYVEQLKQEVEKLREQFLEEYKSFCLTNREAYEKEKAYSTALLQALETECVKVTQLQLAVESKEKNENLKEMLISSGGGISYLFSTPPDIENFRSPSTNRSLAPDFNSTLQVTSLNETKPTETDCRRCNSLEIERASWVKEQSNILKSLHQSESEVIRLKKATSDHRK